MSDKSLSDALGLQPGMRTYFAHPPTDYFDKLGYRPLTFRPDDDGMYDFIHAFFEEKEQLVSSSQILVSKLADDGKLWISWPTPTSNINGDISKEDVKDALLPLGLVDLKSDLVIGDWVGLGFAWKTED